MGWLMLTHVCSVGVVVFVRAYHYHVRSPCAKIVAPPRPWTQCLTNDAFFLYTRVLFPTTP